MKQNLKLAHPYRVGCKLLTQLLSTIGNERVKRNISTLLSIPILVISASCEECECGSNNTNPCGSESVTVKRSDNEVGSVAYHDEESRWMVIRSLTGTYDSQDLGILCDSLPKELQQIGTRVLFSGEYKNYVTI